MAGLQQQQDRRVGWLDEHVDVLVYRDKLASAVADRREELACQAVGAPPDHLLRLLGPVPAGLTEQHRWAVRAGRFEAYRERWQSSPMSSTGRPVDGVEHRA